MTPAPEISIVIPSWNGRDVLAACLESVRQTRGALALETVVVDNASTDGTVAMLAERFADVEVLVNARNEGFARACNQGAAASRAPFLLLLNSDTVLREGAPQRLLALARLRPRAAVVGPRLLNADGSFQSGLAPFPDLGREVLIVSGLGRALFGPTYPSQAPAVERGPAAGDWVGGACMLLRREAFDELGGLDEGYFMYAEELDLCRRLRNADWQVWYEPDAVVVHLGGGSARQLGTESEARHYRGRVRYYRLHHGEAAARWVRALILVATAVKIGVHALLRAASGGRRGRPVVSLRRLRADLRQA